MGSKNRKIKILDIVYWSIIIITMIGFIIKEILGGAISIDGIVLLSQKLGINEYIIMILGTLFIFFFNIIMSIFTHFIFTAFYIGFRIAIKKHNKEKLDENDFKNDTYYRDIIQEYSPAVLSFIDDFYLDNKDVVGTIMSLELKKKIKIDNNEIHILNNDSNGLEQNEKYIFGLIKNNLMSEFNFSQFQNYVIEDAKKDKLLEEKRDMKKNIAKRTMICFLVYIISINAFGELPFMVGENIALTIVAMIIMFVMSIAMAFFPFSTITYIISYRKLNELNPYMRNKEAKEINFKIEGLKNYIKDYSMLKDRESNEIEIWGEYLIYSVIFGQNKEIVDKITRCIQ